MKPPRPDAIYEHIAKNLRDFGYPTCAAREIKDTHVAMSKGEPLPHGVIGAFAKSQIEEHVEAGLLAEVPE